MSQGSKAVAVVELGSVSTKLLITDGKERIRRTVDTAMGGSSLSPTGELRGVAVGPDALRRIEGTLATFADLITEHDVSLARVVGTAGARRAPNSAELAALVVRITGAELEILSAEDEADWSFRGAVSGPGLPARDANDPIITIDIGGGSTEFAAGTRAGPDLRQSIPIGGALLTATYLLSDPPRPEELSAALSVVELHIDDVNRELPQLGPMLAEAATVALGAATTIAAIEVGLADVDPNNGDGDGPLHGFELSRAAVEDVFRTIAIESRADRVFNPGLPPSRVDDVVGACALLVETMRQLDLEQVTVSQRGLMDGLASEMLAAHG